MVDPENLLTAWDGEAPMVDEHCHTPHGEFGWKSWNGASPEVEFCEAAARLASGLYVLETGVGQGYTTRRVAKTARSLTCFESWEPLRQLIRPLLPDGAVMSNKPSPSIEEVQVAELCIFDSSRPFRPQEIRMWWENGSGLCLIHDTGNGHKETANHMKTRTLIKELGCPGFLYGNPRGSALLWHSRPSESLLDVVQLPVLSSL